jgi:hypothetical protein
MRRILREHGGTFTAFPPDLDMLASTNALKLVQEAKFSLLHFATHEVAQFMSCNAGTIKMCGTLLSRIQEMRVDIQTPAPDGSDDERRIQHRQHSGTSFVGPIRDVGGVPHDSRIRGRWDHGLVIDTQTFMRLVVSRRIETALGVAHL